MYNLVLFTNQEEFCLETCVMTDTTELPTNGLRFGSQSEVGLSLMPVSSFATNAYHHIVMVPVWTL